MNDSFANKLRQVSDVLDRERNSLLVGDLKALKGLEVEKTAALDTLLASRGTSGHASALHRVRQMAHQNAALLVAARKGLQAAAQLRKALEINQSELRTYGPSGAIQTESNAETQFTKRS